MDCECLDMLPTVFRVLANPKQLISDDTCLEKLLDWLRDVVQKDAAVLDVSGMPFLKEFFTDVLKLQEPSPGILSFTMRLAGLLSISRTGFQNLQREEILSCLFGESGVSRRLLWDDASVRSGWIQGMHSMMQHQEAAQFFEDSRGVEVTLQLQSDTSMFVVSAATHLLAHIIHSVLQWPLCRPAKSSSCRLSSTADVFPNIDECDWPSCVQKIIALVEASLNSDVSSEVCHSVRILTLVFSQCQTTVAVRLWPKVSGPVGALLRRCPSFVAQPLADLFLTLSRCPAFCSLDSEIWAMLSFALHSFTPPLASNLALGIGKLPECPLSTKLEAYNVILHPMDYVLRASSQRMQETGLLDETVCDPAAVEKLLINRSSCIAFLCQALGHIKDLSDTLPSCPTQFPCSLLVQSVLLVLQFCSDEILPPCVTAATLCQNLIGCVKIQRSSLDTLGSLSKWGAHCQWENVLNVLLGYLKNPESDPVVLQKSFQATCLWLISLCSHREELWPRIHHFLSNEKKDLRTLLFTSGIVDLLMDLLEDPESYVRASTAMALGHLVGITGYLENLPDLENRFTSVEEKIVPQLLNILSDDSEGFPRRAVVKVFTSWLKNHHMWKGMERNIAQVLHGGGHDPDWEVKVNTLNLAETLVQQTLNGSCCIFATKHSGILKPENVWNSLQELYETKLFEILFHTLFDCDRPVAQKSCSILILLKKATVEFCTEMNSEPDKHMLSREMMQDRISSRCGYCMGSADNANLQTLENVIDVLMALNLEVLQCELEQSSDYVVNSPRSLLQDILATALTSSEEIDVDCY
ncbi:BRCA1-associated ATM activator 1 isoform X2 [Protopterus annectens]|uniref:BRCA1-associated ATM activator 1 isoform X2 n=1 Tax=Protopterus annectens TaxID=7888 RepID=UPI001CF96F2F|nr:BRCA1-associated ATM activator 1 isoform X2 [Protopterus annectens]